MFALAGVPAQAQWNFYGNGQSFFVPLYTSANPQAIPDPNPTAQASRFVSLSLSGITQRYLVDTGSLGLVTTLNTYYVPGNDVQIGSGSITYSTSGVNPTGPIYLTNVTINGTNGQSVVARVPVLASTTTTTSQMGIGFDRGGILFNNGTPLSSSYNPNPLLGLVSGPGVSSMQPGYIIGFNGFSNLGLGPGILLGLNNQNTNGFSLVQLTSAGGMPSYCSTPGFNCPLSWSSQNGSVSITHSGQTHNLGPMSVLPDSGIGYMLIQYPNAGLNLTTANCAAGQTSAGNCVRNGATVQVFLPGQTEAAAYTFTVNNTDTPSSNPSTPFGVQVFQGADQPTFANLGRTFFENLTYLYDPINGFVGYQLAGTSGTSATVIPMLALQGGLTLPNGFLSSFTTFLMGGLTLQQTGSGTLSGPIIGPGSLTLQSGNVTLGAANTYAGGTTVNGGTLTIGSTGSITGLLTINPGGNFVNNGTVSSPGQWQLNQGSFTNSGSFVGSLANTGTATNNGMLSGSVINGNSGMFTNNGTVTGSVANMGMWTGGGTIGGDMVNSGVLSGIGTIQGSTTNLGVIAPGNSIGTMTVAGNFTQTASGTYTTEVAGASFSDRINVGGTATLGGQVVVTALPGMTFAPSTTYTIVNAAGGLSGTFTSVNELYPFLLSTLSYDANNAYLNLAIGGFAAAAATQTQIAVGNVLDANVNNAAGDFATVLGAMAFNTFSNTQAQATLQALSGNNYAGFSSSMVQGAQLFMNNFANQTGGGGSPVSNRVALAEACEVACDATTPPKWGAWGGALGGLGTIGANQPVGSVTYNAGGFAAGLDRAITDTFRMGVTAGYTTGTQWVSGFDGMGRTDTFQVGLYGGFAQDKVYADALIGYAYSWNQMWRNIPIPGLPMRTAQGRTGASQWYGQLETGYRFDLGTNANAFITPFARLQAYTANQNAFTETGAQSLNLSVVQQQTNSLRSVIGAQIGGSMDLGWREKLAMQLRLGWSHEYADTARPVSATLAGAPAMPFTTFGVAPQRGGVVLGLSANTAIAEATSIYLRYEGDISGQDSAHALTAGLRMTW